MAKTKKDSIEKSFLQEVRSFLKRLRSGKMHVHAPIRSGLYTKRINATFHATPELFMQIGGATDFDCPSSSFRMQTGEMCIMPRGLPHAETPIDLDMPYSILVFGMERRNLYASNALADSKRQIFSNESILLEGNARPLDLIHYLDEIAEYTTLPKSDQKAYIHSLLNAFLLRISHELDNNPGTESKTAVPLVTEAQKYIRIHLNETSLNVQRIAASLGCTADHLSRQFRKVEGIKLMTWMAEERISMAKYLLEDTQYNIAEVAWASGFNEPSYFIKTFKRHTGMTPRSYRIAINQ